jgi:hypothetical protein
MVNYQKSKIYKITFNGEMKYVGSTVQPLKDRLSGHKTKVCVVKTEGDKIGWENVMIILIENYKCNNKEELTQREQYWINELRPSLNINAAWVKPKEICYVCNESVQSLFIHKSMPRHIEKEMRLLYDFFPEHVEQDIKQWNAEYMDKYYGTPKRMYMTQWARGVERGFASGEPPFEFDESEYVLIRNYDGVECNRFIGNYWDKQRLGMVDRVFG